MRTVVDVFLLPPDPPPAALAEAVKAVEARLAAAQSLVLATTAWRPIDFELYAADGDERAQDLLSAIVVEVRRRDLIARRAAAVPDLPAADRPLQGQVLVGVARQSPERVASFGEAIAAACRKEDRDGALVARGRLGLGTGEAGAAFDRSLLDGLANGDDAVSGTDAGTWLAGRPDAELAHIFLLLGAAGPGARAEVLGYERTKAGGLAVLAIRPGDPDVAGPASRPFMIPVKEITRG